MFLRILVIFSLFLSLAFSQTAVVRVGKYPDKERIVLQLDRKVDYKVLTLESPKRIVVDIMEDYLYLLQKACFLASWAGLKPHLQTCSHNHRPY